MSSIYILLIILSFFNYFALGENDNSKEIPGLRDTTFIVIGIVVIVALILLLVLFIIYCRVQEESQSLNSSAWSNLSRKKLPDGSPLLSNYDSTDEDIINNDNDHDIV